jgi:hypothetical protein
MQTSYSLSIDEDDMIDNNNDINNNNTNNLIISIAYKSTYQSSNHTNKTIHRSALTTISNCISVA